jgi:hypothetical protein
MPRPSNPDEESLKRLGGGRWQTRDERFTIEPQSGTWSVVDAEETDDLGLPLVRGPFRSLTDAKEAIGSARASAAPKSPLAERIERQPDRGRESTADDQAGGPGDGTASRERSPRGRPASQSRRAGDHAANTSSRDPAPSHQARESPAQAAEPEEPGWFRDLTPAERGRARRLIDHLTSEGEDDAVSIVRRDLVGDVPALAAHAIERRLGELGSEASVADVVELLADGRDRVLGVRWRVVDGDGRPILIEPPKRSRRSP